MKKLCPYGKQLQENIAKNGLPRNDIFLFFGKNAWRKATSFAIQQAVLVLPDNESPYQYFFPVENCSILAVATSPVPIHAIKQLAHCVLSYRALIMRAILPDGSLVIYRR